MEQLYFSFVSFGDGGDLELRGEDRDDGKCVKGRLSNYGRDGWVWKSLDDLVCGDHGLFRALRQRVYDTCVVNFRK